MLFTASEFNCTDTNDPNERLIDAVESDNLTQAMYLLSCKQVDINQIDENTGATALLRACEKNYEDLFELLIDQENIDPNIAPTYPVV